MAKRKGPDRKPYMKRAAERERRKADLKAKERAYIICNKLRAEIDCRNYYMPLFDNVLIKGLKKKTYEKYCKYVAGYIYRNFLKYKNKPEMWAEKGLDKDRLELARIIFNLYRNFYCDYGKRRFIENAYFKNEILYTVKMEIYILGLKKQMWGDFEINSIPGMLLYEKLTDDKNCSLADVYNNICTSSFAAAEKNRSDGGHMK